MNDIKFIGDNIGMLVSGVVPMVSQCNLGVKKNGDTVYPSLKSNIEFDHVPFSKAMCDTAEITERHNKGTDGMIFPFVDERRVYHSKEDMIANNVTTGGVLFLDIDHYDYIDQVVEHFNDYVQLLPDLMSMVYSWSGNGLHIYFITDNLNAEQYSLSVVRHFVAFYVATKRILGDEMASQMPRHNDKKVCDPSCCAFTQREFLAYSKTICWNQYATQVVYDRDTLKHFDEILQQDEWRELRNKTTDKTTQNIRNQLNEEFRKDNEYDVTVTEPTNIKYIEHTQRWMLCDSLCCLYEGEDLKREWQRCVELMVEDNGHSRHFYLTEPDHNHWWTKPDKRFSTKLLKMFGYIVTPKVKPSTTTNDHTTLPKLEELRTQYNVIDISMSPTEYMSDYSDVLTSTETTYNYIAAGTGTGKTEFVKSMQLKQQEYVTDTTQSDLFTQPEEHDSVTERFDLCYPMISTRNGKRGLNVIETKDVTSGKKSPTEIWENPQSLTFTVDTLVALVERLKQNNCTTKRDNIFIDESHMAVSEIDYRTNTMYNVMFSLAPYYNHIYYMSGTTWEEYTFLPNNDLTIFNCTKPQLIRTTLTWYNYTPDRVTEDNNGKKHTITRTFHQHLREKIYNNKNHNIKSIIYANNMFSTMENICEPLRNKGFKVGVYSRRTKQGITVNDINLQNTINDNDIILSTCYLGVGVEIKDMFHFDYIFVDNNITAQEIQQVKERSRTGNMHISIYRSTITTEEKEPIPTIEELNETIVKKLNSSDKLERTVWVDTFGEKPYIVYDAVNNKYEYNKMIYDMCVLRDTNREIFSDRQYIIDYFSERGVQTKELTADISKYTNRKKRDNTTDGEYILQHFDEVCNFYKNRNEYESAVDVFVEYEVSSKKQPQLTDGKYYFNNTNYVLELLHLLCDTRIDRYKVRDFCIEKNKIIDVNRLKEYYDILKIVEQYNDLHIILKHIIGSLEKDPIDLEDKKAYNTFVKKEVNYIMTSKKLNINKYEKITRTMIEDYMKNIVRFSTRLFLNHADIMDEVKQAISNTDEGKIHEIMDIVVNDLFLDIMTDKRNNEHSKKKITVDGVEYESIKCACEALGWEYGNIRKKIQRSGDSFSYKGHSVQIFE